MSRISSAYMCVSLRLCKKSGAKKRPGPLLAGLWGYAFVNSHNFLRPTCGGREGCGRIDAWRIHEADLNVDAQVLQGRPNRAPQLRLDSSMFAASMANWFSLVG